jgi:hypothetical protein
VVADDVGHAQLNADSDSDAVHESRSHVERDFKQQPDSVQLPNSVTNDVWDTQLENDAVAVAFFFSERVRVEVEYS